MSNNEGRKRESRVTIKDVAKAAGVSIATVSYVLNNKPGQSISDETRKKVLQFANLLGYECNIMARYLATGKTNSVAAVVKDISPLAAQYYIKLLTELSSLLKRMNYDMKLVDYNDGLQHVDCDAFVTVALTEAEFRSFADTKYVPVIAIDSIFDDFLFYRINDDHKNMSESAKRESDADRISLLTFELPQECIASAKKHFVDVAVVRTLDDIAELDRETTYVTVSKLLYDNASKRVPVRLESASYALKAAATADAVMKAIEHINASPEEHDIRI